MLGFMEISARDYHKVENAFHRVAEGILGKIEKGDIPLSQGVGVKVGDQDKPVLNSKIGKNKKKGCC